MLPPVPRLATLTCRFLNLKCLEIDSGELGFIPDVNPLVGSSLPYDDPCTVPLSVNYCRDFIDDGFYKVSVSLHRQLEVPAVCQLQILHWTIDVTPRGLQFIVQKASVISTLHLSFISETCKLEKNCRVSQLLKRLAHKKLIEHFIGNMDLEEGSVASTNSALQTQNLARLRQQTLDQEPFEAIEAPPLSAIHAKEAQTTQSLHRHVDQGAQTSQIGYDAKKLSLKGLTATDFSEEDLLSLHQDDTTFTLQPINEEPGVFPGWALEYLRFYYKV